MPMIDLTLPEGALTEDALDGLADSLMRALLRSEHVPEDNATRELVSWVHVHELPLGRMYAGGKRLQSAAPFFRIDVSIPAGVVDADEKAAFIAEATGLVLEAAGVDPGDRDAAARVWVLPRDPRRLGRLRPPPLEPPDREDRRRERGAHGQGRRHLEPRSAQCPSCRAWRSRAAAR
jgi:phenylpyruvate tautomerase PptA (4-oxalocrotonate tautomerase family)